MFERVAGDSRHLHGVPCEAAAHSGQRGAATGAAEVVCRELGILSGALEGGATGVYVRRRGTTLRACRVGARCSFVPRRERPVAGSPDRCPAVRAAMRDALGRASGARSAVGVGGGAVWMENAAGAVASASAAPGDKATHRRGDCRTSSGENVIVKRRPSFPEVQARLFGVRRILVPADAWNCSGANADDVAPRRHLMSFAACDSPTPCAIAFGPGT